MKALLSAFNKALKIVKGCQNCSTLLLCSAQPSVWSWRWSWHRPPPYLQPFITLGHVMVSWDLDKHLIFYKIYLEHSKTLQNSSQQMAAYPAPTSPSTPPQLLTLHDGSDGLKKIESWSWQEQLLRPSPGLPIESRTRSTSHQTISVEQFYTVRLNHRGEINIFVDFLNNDMIWRWLLSRGLDVLKCWKDRHRSGTIIPTSDHKKDVGKLGNHLPIFWTFWFLVLKIFVQHFKIFSFTGPHHRGAGQVGQHRRRDLGEGDRAGAKQEDREGLRSGPGPHRERVRGGFWRVPDRGEWVREPAAGQQDPGVQGTDWQGMQTENGRQRQHSGQEALKVRGEVDIIY